MPVLQVGCRNDMPATPTSQSGVRDSNCSHEPDTLCNIFVDFSQYVQTSIEENVLNRPWLPTTCPLKFIIYNKSLKLRVRRDRFLIYTNGISVLRKIQTSQRKA